MGDPAAPDYALSESDITSDGPFSDYTGYDRTIVLLAGNGFELTFAGGEVARVDHDHPAFTFDGKRPVMCRLIDGPVRVFNTISAQARFRHTLELGAASSGSINVADCERAYLHGTIETLRIIGPASVHDAAPPFRLIRIRTTALAASIDRD